MEDFDFSELPLHLQTHIVEKLTYKEFARFDETSRLAHEICHARKYSFEYVVPQIFVEETEITVSVLHYDVEPYKPYEFFRNLPVRFTAQNLVLSGQIPSATMSEISLLFEKNGTRGKVLKLKDEIKFKPDDLERLIEVTSMRSTLFFTCNEFLPREFLRCSGLQNMKYFSINTTDCSDDEVVALKATDMDMITNFVTSKGLNELLKQWKRKEREIESIVVKCDSTDGIRDVTAILEGIDANPIWTPDWHDDSILSKVPMAELDFTFADDPTHYYSIWRPEDPEETIIIQLNNDRFHAFAYRGEFDFLIGRLDRDQRELLELE